MYRALSFELSRDVEGSPAEERAAEARDDDGDDVAYPVHTVILASGLALRRAVYSRMRR
jgi:hypothetical protein